MFPVNLSTTTKVGPALHSLNISMERLLVLDVGRFSFFFFFSVNIKYLISALGTGGFEANTFSYFLVYVVEIVESMKPEAMRKQYIFR
jgi:hypothetical protein